MLRRPNLLDNLKAYLRGFTSNGRRLFDQFKLVTHLERIAAADPTHALLDRVVATFVGVDLSPTVVDNHMMGTAFEDLNRRFLEQANEKAGEQYTPRDVITLIVDLCLAGSGDRFVRDAVRPKIYDPACGTGGMLSVADNRLREQNPKARPLLFGQEWSEETWAICQADLLVRGENPEYVAQGNTLTEDRHADERFDWQLSNPLFGVDWKGYEKAIRREHEDAQWKGRFGAGLPGVSDGSLLFVQHMVSKLRVPSQGGGRIAVVLNGSPLFTGKAGSGESEIRKWLVTDDLLEAIVALPEQLFFNIGIPTYLWLLSNKKPAERKGKVQLIDATGLGDRMKRALGGKRNEIGDRARETIVALYRDFTEGPQSRIVAADELGYREVIVEYPMRMRFAATPERVAAVGTEASLGEPRPTRWRPTRWRPTPCTPRPTPCTPRPTPCTPRPTPCTPRPTRWRPRIELSCAAGRVEPRSGCRVARHGLPRRPSAVSTAAILPTMTDARPVLVTGASGNVGAPLVSPLRAAGLPVIATATRPQPDARRLDFEDPSTFAPALAGVGRVCLMRPPQISDTRRFIRPFIRAMEAAGVAHVALLSLMGVNPAMPHWRVEQDLRASSLAWTFLRPSFFAQNLGAAYRAAIRDRDRDRLASGLGRTSFIDTRDGEADDERAIGRRRARADRADHHAQAEHELVVRR